MLFTTSKPKIKWDEKYSERSIKRTLLDLLIYIIFLIVTSILAYNLSGAHMYYFTRLMRRVFIEQNFNDLTFESINLIDEFWLYCENILLPGLFGREDKMIIEENQLIGLTRIRQIRIKNNSCKIHYLFAKEFKYCYAEFTTKDQDKGALVRKEHIWKYKSEDLFLNIKTTYGMLSSYPSGGHIQDFGNTDYNETIELLEMLKTNDWIDRGTRAVIIEFTIYNGNTNLFCVAKLIFEIPPSGGIIPSYVFRTVKLLRFRSAWDYAVLVLEIFYAILIIYYLGVEIWEMRNDKFWKYVSSFWNWIDLLIILLSFFAIAFSIFSYAFIKRKIEEFLSTNNKIFISFELLSFWQLIYNNILAIITFLVWMKLLKFISFNESMLQFSSTLQRCAKDLFGFAIMFIIVFVAFAQLGYLLFGMENPDFRDFKNAIFTLMRTILGDFDYVALEQANWVLGPIYFLAFIFLVFFVLLNMFLAIINDTYSDVKSEPNTHPLHLWRVLRSICGGKRKDVDESKSSIEVQIQNESAEIPQTQEDDSEFKQFVKNELNTMDKRIETVEIAIDGIVNRLDVLIQNLERIKLKSG